MAHNMCVFSGRVVKKPELQQTANGVSFCKFWLLVDRGYKELSDFVPIQAWKDVAKKCMALEQNSFALINGVYQSNSYERDGKREYSHNIVAKSVELIGQAAVQLDEEDFPF